MYSQGIRHLSGDEEYDENTGNVIVPGEEKRTFRNLKRADDKLKSLSDNFVQTLKNLNRTTYMYFELNRRIHERYKVCDKAVVILQYAYGAIAIFLAINTYVPGAKARFYEALRKKYSQMPRYPVPSIQTNSKNCKNTFFFPLFPVGKFDFSNIFSDEYNHRIHQLFNFI